MNETIEIGDFIKIISDGCNNSRVKEFDKFNILSKSETVYKVMDIKASGSYYSNNLLSATLILSTGNPVWENHCKLVRKKEKVIDTYTLI